MGVDDAEADVVAERADVGDVVVQPLELEQYGAPHARLVWDDAPAGVFDRQAVGQGVADCGITGDPFGQLDPRGEIATLEQPLDALVDEPQSCRAS